VSSGDAWESGAHIRQRQSTSARTPSGIPRCRDRATLAAIRCASVRLWLSFPPCPHPFRRSGVRSPGRTFLQEGTARNAMPPSTIPKTARLPHRADLAAAPRRVTPGLLPELRAFPSADGSTSSETGGGPGSAATAGTTRHRIFTGAVESGSGGGEWFR
jgi:hypothetical protein